MNADDRGEQSSAEILDDCVVLSEYHPPNKRMRGRGRQRNFPETRREQGKSEPQDNRGNSRRERSPMGRGRNQQRNADRRFSGDNNRRSPPRKRSPPPNRRSRWDDPTPIGKGDTGRLPMEVYSGIRDQPWNGNGNMPPEMQFQQQQLGGFGLPMPSMMGPIQQPGMPMFPLQNSGPGNNMPIGFPSVPLGGMPGMPFPNQMPDMSQQFPIGPTSNLQPPPMFPFPGSFPMFPNDIQPVPAPVPAPPAALGSALDQLQQVPNNPGSARYSPRQQSMSPEPRFQQRQRSPGPRRSRDRDSGRSNPWMNRDGSPSGKNRGIENARSSWSGDRGPRQGPDENLQKRSRSRERKRGSSRDKKPRNNADEPQIFPVAIAHVEHPATKLTEEQSVQIRSDLMIAISREEPGKGPRFDGITFRGGCLQIRCEAESVLWLEDQFRFSRGLKIISIAEASKPKALIKVIARLKTYNMEDGNAILKALQTQNQGLKTENWRILSMCQRRDGHELELEIDHKSADVLAEMNWQPFFGFSRATFERLEEDKAPPRREEKRDKHRRESPQRRSNLNRGQDEYYMAFFDQDK